MDFGAFADFVSEPLTGAVDAVEVCETERLFAGGAVLTGVGRLELGFARLLF